LATEPFPRNRKRPYSMLTWLLELGADIEQTDQFGTAI
jgi:hypothetical protein